MRRPTARAGGIAELAVVVDAHERYGYTFAGKPVVTTRQALPRGDYGLMADGRLVAVVERKSLSDLFSSLLSGKLKYQMTGLAEMQISFPNVPIVFCQTRKFAEEYISAISPPRTDCSPTTQMPQWFSRPPPARPRRP